MIDETHTLEVNLFGKSYRFACAPQEQQKLLAAADFINHWVDQQPEQPKSLNNESLSAMVALNMAHQLLELRAKHNHAAEVVTARIKKVLDQKDVQSVTRIGVDL